MQNNSDAAESTTVASACEPRFSAVVVAEESVVDVTAVVPFSVGAALEAGVTAVVLGGGSVVESGVGSTVADVWGLFEVTGVVIGELVSGVEVLEAVLGGMVDSDVGFVDCVLISVVVGLVLEVVL